MDLEILFKLVWTHITVCKWKHKRWPYEDEDEYVLQSGNNFRGMNLTHSLKCTVHSHDKELESADKTGNWKQDIHPIIGAHARWTLGHLHIIPHYSVLYYTSLIKFDNTQYYQYMYPELPPNWLNQSRQDSY